MEDGRRDLLIKVSVDKIADGPDGVLHRGSGPGAGYWYAILKYPSNGQIFGTVRLRELGNDEVDIWHRPRGERIWGDPCKAAKDVALASRADTCSLGGAIKQAKLRLTNLSSMYMFAMVARSKKWFEAKGLPLADTMRQMLIESVQDPNAFNHWHRKLAPEQGFFERLRNYGSGDAGNVESVKKLMQDEYRRGILHEPNYTKTLQTYREQLLAKMDEALRQMSDQMFSRLKQHVISQKKAELQKDRADNEVELERHVRNDLSRAMQSLAPPNAMSIMLTRMVSRFSGNYRLHYEKEVEGCPKLFCKLEHLKVEKQLFEQVLAGEGDHLQVELEASGPEFALDVQDPDDVHLLGSLSKERVFWISSHEIPDGGKGVKFHCSARSQPTKELLNIKRPTSSVAFNETLRMLALYNQASKVVAVYVWDEAFTRHTDYCAPINLEAYVQDADLLQMHFLPASKQLCFVLRNNMVKVYELVAKTMRPRGFQIAPHAKTFVDSTGTALVVLRQESSKWMVDVILVADGRQVKTLALPLALQDEVPVVDILRLYGVDFLVALDSATKTLHGWRLHLQTAEQVCSMEQVGEKAVETTKCQSAGMACFDILYQVLAKFTNHPALGADLAQQMTRLIVVGPAMSSNPGPVVERYVADIIRRLRQDTQKPSLDGFNLDVSYWPVSSNEGAGDVVSNLQSSEMTMAQLLRKLICLVPLQIARAENESFVILKDGMREDVSDFSNLSELAEFISFGLYELVLESNENPVVVISSMGKQSTGKSYMLNHLAGTSFDTSGGRCTDGVWMTVREHSDITYVMLDFEGLGSFERSAQEDMLLSVFNAAISHVSLFRTENRLDCDTASIFSRMQQGAKLIQGDEELFNGFFQIVVKDVVSDAKEVAQEFRQKIQHIIARDKEDNFFLRLYKGRVGILPFPALGRAEFYREFNSLTSKVRAAQAEKRCFESGRQYLRNTKLLMAKIAMKDWTPTDQNKIKMLLASLQECLATAVMAGCMAVTEDGPVPLLHLRSNKTFLDKGSEGDEPEMNSILAAVPDEGLQLALVQEQDGALDVEVSCEIMASLLSKLKAAVNCSTATDWTPVLQALAQRRQKRIVAWLEANVEHVAGEGDAQRLLMVAKTVLARLLQKLRLCGQDCGMCRLPCTLPVDHSSSSHDCGTDHKCHAFCHYCASDGVAAACVQPAGHSAEHDCGDAAHTCGAECSLSNLGNCGGRCVLKPGHSEEQHLCGSKRHHCGKPCALSTCQHSCVLPHDLMHDRCECHIIVCPNKCTFPNCTFMCSEQDHFHTEGHSGDGCMCDQPHQCPHECEAPGICEIYSELVVKKQKFTGKHDTFDYDAIETEQNGVRKGCCKVVPPKSRQHEGEHIHSSTENLVHYCDVKCPTCGYYCTLPWEHSGEHDTRHGNMRRTYFVSDEDVFTLGSRKYAPAESGVAEMCNMYCHRAGRGHTHVKLCADYSSGQGGQCCISAMPGRRHSMRQYKPNPEIPKDEFTHEAFWESTGFKDPCSNEDKEVFGKCNHFCPHASHMKDGELPSFCTLPLWHAALSDQEGKEYVRQHGGIVSPDGHHFSCSHRTSLPVHTIFLIDKSGSMSYNDVVPETRPWRDSHPNRLGCALAAIQSFVEKRQHSSPDDKISLLAFDTDALNGPSMVSISDFDTCHQWLSNLEANYQTSFANAMAATIPLVQQTPNSHRSMVMFLSDGWDHFPAQALQRVFAAVARSTPGKALRLHTVQFPAQHGSDADVLAQMAQAARNHAAFDDEFAQASSSMQSVDNISLQETFMGIAESLSSAAGGLITAS
ncbi:unnamed protein product [Durusdinium trenchii]|uniref:VWFA domain-containing protein n=1 Tax=Durusdinium trenchii TaxID=1381693 RepID=A0ABP0N9K8_9DINO